MITFAFILLFIILLLLFVLHYNYEARQYELLQHKQGIRHEIIKLRLERLEKEYYMNGETLRQNTIEGIDKTLSKPLVVLELGPDNVRLLKTQRAFWVAATEDELQRLLDNWRNT